MSRWREHRVCQLADAQLFDSRLDDTVADRESPYVRGVRHGRAVAICAQCPVAQWCLSDALADPKREGIHAGYLLETEDE